MNVDRWVAIEAALFVPILAVLEWEFPVVRHLGLISAGVAWAMWTLAGTMLWNQYNREEA